LAGCGARTCTDIGCAYNGLSVDVVATTFTPADTFRVEVTDLSRGTHLVKDCTRWADCQSIEFASFWPSHVRVQISSSVGTVTQDATPNYSESYPNGPDCGACRRATVAIALPS